MKAYFNERFKKELKIPGEIYLAGYQIFSGKKKPFSDSPEFDPKQMFKYWLMEEKDENNNVQPLKNMISTSIDTIWESDSKVLKFNICDIPESAINDWVFDNQEDYYYSIMVYCGYEDLVDLAFILIPDTIDELSYTGNNIIELAFNPDIKADFVNTKNNISNDFDFLEGALNDYKSRPKNILLVDSTDEVLVAKDSYYRLLRRNCAEVGSDEGRYLDETGKYQDAYYTYRTYSKITPILFDSTGGTMLTKSNLKTDKDDYVQIRGLVEYEEWAVGKNNSVTSIGTGVSEVSGVDGVKIVCDKVNSNFKYTIDESWNRILYSAVKLEEGETSYGIFHLEISYVDEKSISRTIKSDKFKLIQGASESSAVMVNPSTEYLEGGKRLFMFESNKKPIHKFTLRVNSPSQVITKDNIKISSTTTENWNYMDSKFSVICNEGELMDDGYTNFEFTLTAKAVNNNDNPLPFKDNKFELIPININIIDTETSFSTISFYLVQKPASVDINIYNSTDNTEIDTLILNNDETSHKVIIGLVGSDLKGDYWKLTGNTNPDIIKVDKEIGEITGVATTAKQSSNTYLTNSDSANKINIQVNAVPETRKDEDYGTLTFTRYLEDPTGKDNSSNWSMNLIQSSATLVIKKAGCPPKTIIPDSLKNKNTKVSKIAPIPVSIESNCDLYCRVVPCPGYLDEFKKYLNEHFIIADKVIEDFKWLTYFPNNPELWMTVFVSGQEKNITNIDKNLYYIKNSEEINKKINLVLEVKYFDYNLHSGQVAHEDTLTQYTANDFSIVDFLSQSTTVSYADVEFYYDKELTNYAGKISLGTEIDDDLDDIPSLNRDRIDYNGTYAENIKDFIWKDRYFFIPLDAPVTIYVKRCYNICTFTNGYGDYNNYVYNNIVGGCYTKDMIVSDYRHGEWGINRSQLKNDTMYNLSSISNYNTVNFDLVGSSDDSDNSIDFYINRYSYAIGQGDWVSMRFYSFSDNSDFKVKAHTKIHTPTYENGELLGFGIKAYFPSEADQASGECIHTCPRAVKTYLIDESMVTSKTKNWKLLSDYKYGNPYYTLYFLPAPRPLFGTIGGDSIGYSNLRVASTTNGNNKYSYWITDSEAEKNGRYYLETDLTPIDSNGNKIEKDLRTYHNHFKAVIPYPSSTIDCPDVFSSIFDGNVLPKNYFSQIILKFKAAHLQAEFAEMQIDTEDVCQKAGKNNVEIGTLVTNVKDKNYFNIELGKYFLSNHVNSNSDINCDKFIHFYIKGNDKLNKEGKSDPDTTSFGKLQLKIRPNICNRYKPTYDNFFSGDLYNIYYRNNINKLFSRISKDLHIFDKSNESKQVCSLSKGKDPLELLGYYGKIGSQPDDENYVGPMMWSPELKDLDTRNCNDELQFNDNRFHMYKCYGYRKITFFDFWRDYISDYWQDMENIFAWYFMCNNILYKSEYESSFLSFDSLISSSCIKTDVNNDNFNYCYTDNYQGGYCSYYYPSVRDYGKEYAVLDDGSKVPENIASDYRAELEFLEFIQKMLTSKIELELLYVKDVIYTTDLEDVSFNGGSIEPTINYTQPISPTTLKIESGISNCSLKLNITKLDGYETWINGINDNNDDYYYISDAEYSIKNSIKITNTDRSCTVEDYVNNVNKLKELAKDLKWSSNFSIYYINPLSAKGRGEDYHYVACNNKTNEFKKKEFTISGIQNGHDSGIDIGGNLYVGESGDEIKYDAESFEDRIEVPFKLIRFSSGGEIYSFGDSIEVERLDSAEENYTTTATSHSEPGNIKFNIGRNYSTKNREFRYIIRFTDHDGVENSVDIIIVQKGYTSRIEWLGHDTYKDYMTTAFGGTRSCYKLPFLSDGSCLVSDDGTRGSLHFTSNSNKLYINQYPTYMKNFLPESLSIEGKSNGNYSSGEPRYIFTLDVELDPNNNKKSKVLDYGGSDFNDLILLISPEPKTSVVPKSVVVFGIYQGYYNLEVNEDWRRPKASIDISDQTKNDKFLTFSSNKREFNINTMDWDNEKELSLKGLVVENNIKSNIDSALNGILTGARIENSSTDLDKPEFALKWESVEVEEFKPINTNLTVTLKDNLFKTDDYDYLNYAPELEFELSVEVEQQK